MGASLNDAYNVAAESWATGADGLYERLSRVIVAASPEPLRRARVLDLGSGTGATSKALRAAGAAPLALDRAIEMLRHDRGRRPPGVVGDAGALPFRSAIFDAVVAAFSVSHLPDPVVALTEAGRVTRPGGVVLVGVFRAGSDHPAKTRVEEVAVAHGYRRPPWYEWFKTQVEPLTARPEELRDLAGAAGLEDVSVAECPVDLGRSSSARLVAWRLATPALAPFVASLGPRRRRALWSAAEAAVGPDPQRWRPTVLILSSRAAT